MNRQRHGSRDAASHEWSKQVDGLEDSKAASVARSRFRPSSFQRMRMRDLYESAISSWCGHFGLMEWETNPRAGCRWIPLCTTMR